MKTRNTVGLLLAFAMLLSGCGNNAVSSSREGDAIRDGSDPASSAASEAEIDAAEATEPAPTQPEAPPAPPPVFPRRENDLLNAPAGPAFAVTQADWIVKEGVLPQQLDDENNQYSTDTETGAETARNPQTGRETVLLFRDEVLTVTVDGKTILTSTAYDNYTKNGTHCSWLNDSVLLFRSVWSGSFLYNADTGNLSYFCYPFEETVPLTSDNDIDYDALPSGLAYAGLLDVDVAHNRCLYTVDSQDGDERTIYYYRWDTGEYFPILDEPFLPPGTDVPVRLMVAAEFESEDTFYFSVDNRDNMNNQGEDVGDAYFRVDVPTRTVEQIMTTGTDIMYYRTLGDYRVYYRREKVEQNRGEIIEYLFYNWRTGTLDFRLDAQRIHAWSTHTILVVNREQTQTHIVDLETRNDYVLQNRDLYALYPGMKLEFGNFAVTIADPLSDSERTVLPDVEAILGG